MTPRSGRRSASGGVWHCQCGSDVEGHGRGVFDAYGQGRTQQEVHRGPGHEESCEDALRNLWDLALPAFSRTGGTYCLTRRCGGEGATEKAPAVVVRRVAEWDNDGGTAAAAAHRAELVEHLARCRAALDEFEPDLVVVWGDDQYENFREEVVPPFCVLAYDDLEVPAFEVMNERGSPNAWGLPDDFTITLHGDPHAARSLANALIENGFDMAYSYRKRAEAHFPHAILNTQIFLDYENAGSKLPYPIVPITVNCYGQHAIARKGGLARFADIADEQLDPVGPTRTVASISAPP